MPEREPRAAASPWRLLFPAALVLALLPFVVVIVVTLLDGGHTPIADRALTELKVRDVGLHPVTLGLYSRDGWAHPGPMLFYLLAVPYRLLGSDMNALMVGAALINGAAVAAIGIVARRVGGVGAGVLMLLAASVVARAFGMNLIVDPWVCWVTVLPFGVFCLLTWALVDGRIWALPLTAVVATYLAQTHVGFAPIAAPAAVVGAVWLVVRVRRTTPERTRRLVWTVVGTAAGLLVLWAPPLWDQVFGSHNLETVAKWFRDAKEPGHTLGEGVRIVGGQFAIWPDWVSGARRFNAFNGETTLLHRTLVPVLLVGVVVAVVVAIRRRDRIARNLLVILGVVVASAVLAVAGTKGIMYEYRLLWIWTLAAVVCAGALFAIWRGARSHLPVWSRSVVACVLLALLAGVVVAQTADALDAERHYDWDSRELATAVARAETHLRRDGGQVLLTAESFDGNWYLQGALLALEHAGFDARVGGDVAETYGAHRVRSAGPLQARLLVLANSDLVGYTGRPGWHPIGFSARRPLAATAAEGARIDAERQRLKDELAAGRLTVDEYARRDAALPHVPSAVLILERDR